MLIELPFLVAELRASMVDGYTPDDVNRAFGRIKDALGVDLVCVWEYHDDFGYGGNSDFYVRSAEGAVHELAGYLWPWLNRALDDPEAPEHPGDPATWTGPTSDVTDDLADDGFHNAAPPSERCGNEECRDELGGNGYDGLCDSCADRTFGDNDYDL
ncbi:hypothetical protein [Streptacidiphilus jiangxiensis]|uniref:Uncharacterized protein n=1 Tax=Streptacidiphilus jiangxiensis TaxID=235985 RepID=A0A1H8B4D6_STRJI|nr:hypothetical protein [Streptacidiphilus jiangxiensis]SEM77820.1 hypothetical protein SAMN05414137_15713 [Streptacidiphilus jiangxiensis]